MKAVGLRELKNRLSAYVRQVRAGEGVLVTDRGQVVAELGPPGRTIDVVEPIDEGGLRASHTAGTRARTHGRRVTPPAREPDGRAAAS